MALVDSLNFTIIHYSVSPLDVVNGINQNILIICWLFGAFHSRSSLFHPVVVDVFEFFISVFYLLIIERLDNYNSGRIHPTDDDASTIVQYYIWFPLIVQRDSDASGQMNLLWLDSLDLANEHTSLFLYYS